jgi:hypothetical protein
MLGLVFCAALENEPTASTRLETANIPSASFRILVQNSSKFSFLLTNLPLPMAAFGS